MDMGIVALTGDHDIFEGITGWQEGFYQVRKVVWHGTLNLT